MICKFTDWCLNVQPDWAGTTLYLTGLTSLSTLIVAASGLLLYWTQGYILLALPPLVLYALYLAIFNQGENK
jgi:hypothetical protein